MNYFIIVFKNTHDAMTAEKQLEAAGFKFRIMPTPTLITQSCGICVRIEAEEDINNIMNGTIVEFKNIYKKENSKYDLVK